jgi:hypothetical protein
MRHKTASTVVGLLLLLTLPGTAHADPVTIVTVIGWAAEAYKTIKEANDFYNSYILKKPSDLDNAVTELKAFERGYRDQDLVDGVNGDLMNLKFIASNYDSALTPYLEAGFILSANAHLASLEGDMKTGTIDDYYYLMPAYNLLTFTFVAAVKEFGLENPNNAYPQDALDQYLVNALLMDYGAVGALWVEYDISCDGCSQTTVTTTLGGKAMWPRYGNLLTMQDPWGIGLIFNFDMTAPRNTHSNVMTDCGLLFHDACVNGFWDEVRAFIADPAVQVVDQAMYELINNPSLNYSITDYNPNGGSSTWGSGHILVQY